MRQGSFFTYGAAVFAGVLFFSAWALPSQAAAEKFAPPRGRAAKQHKAPPRLNMDSLAQALSAHSAEAETAPKKQASGAAELLRSEEMEKTALDFSFGGDDDENRVDGGLAKERSVGSVGLRRNFSKNWQIGGAAVFAGKGRGGAASLGYKW